MNKPKKKVDKSKRIIGGQKGADRALTGLQNHLWNFVNDKRANWPVSYVPGLNLNKNPWVQQWDVENVMNLYQKFPYYCDYPRPLLPPSKLPRTVFTGGDPGFDIVTEKKCILEQAEKMCAHYTKFQDKFTEKGHKMLEKFEINHDIGGDKLPRFVADISNVLEMDPDQFFKGHYNYYYTGGSMDTIRLNGNQIIIFPFSNEIIVSPLTCNDKSMWKLNIKNASKWKIDGTVYEIKHKIDSSTCRVFTRFKNETNVHTLIDKKGKIKLYQVDSKESTVPLISGDLDPFNINKACTLNMNGRLRIWDLVKSKVKTYHEDVNDTPDNWRCVRYQKSQNILTLTNRCCVRYIDLRSNDHKPVLKMCPKDYFEICDDVISYEMPSVKDFRHYVGTYHTLLMLDCRVPNDSVQQKWSHRLESAPLFGNTHMLNGDEVVTLSSQKPKDSVIILNTWQDLDAPHSYYLPYSPSHILDTLRESHHLGKCLDPLLKRRLELTTAGSKIIEDDDGNLYNLLQNSVGDVFYQCISHSKELNENSFVNTQAYYSLEMWEKQMLSQGEGIVPLVLSDQANMRSVFRNFSNKKLKYKHREFEESGEPITWKQSVTKLEKYKDVLASSLLPIWEVSEEKDNLPQAPPMQKVLNWLEHTTAGSEDDIEEINDGGTYSMEPVNSQELVSVSQQVRNNNNNDDDDDPIILADPIIEDESSYFLPVRVKNTTKKTSKKKTNRADGFL